MTGRNYEGNIVNFVLNKLVLTEPCFPQQLMSIRVPDRKIPTIDQGLQIYKVYPEMEDFWVTGYHKGLFYTCRDGVFMIEKLTPSFLYIVKEV